MDSTQTGRSAVARFPVTTERVRVGIVELAVDLAGPRDAPTLILLHGFPESRATWRPLLPTLLNAGFRVIVPDQRGYGDSDRPANVAAYDLDLLADDVVGLATALDVGSYAIVGHDWGASVGWWLATREPDRVARLAALSAPHPAVWRDAMRRDPEQRRRSRYLRLLTIPRIPEWLVRLGRYRALLEAHSLSADSMEGRAAVARWARPGALTAMIDWYRAWMRRDFEDLDRYRTTTPVLLLHGADDPFIADTAIRGSRSLGASVQTVSLPEQRHALLDPAAFATIEGKLLAFLRGGWTAVP